MSKPDVRTWVIDGWQRCWIAHQFDSGTDAFDNPAVWIEVVW